MRLIDFKIKCLYAFYTKKKILEVLFCKLMCIHNLYKYNSSRYIHRYIISFSSFHNFYFPATKIIVCAFYKKKKKNTSIILIASIFVTCTNMDS